MDIGMFWYCSNPKLPLLDHVREAAAFYQAKYGQAPTMCYVHPDALPPGSPQSAGALRLRPLRTVIKNHLWLGVADLEMEPPAPESQVTP